MSCIRGKKGLSVIVDLDLVDNRLRLPFEREKKGDEVILRRGFEVKKCLVVKGRQIGRDGTEVMFTVSHSERGVRSVSCKGKGCRIIHDGPLSLGVLEACRPRGEIVGASSTP